MSEEEVYALKLASEKGSSSWLNALPLEKYGFHLTKGEFRDGLCFRYSWEPKNTPSVCPCSKKFTLAHALQCPKGGYTIMRHNEIRDTFANFMDEVCHDVQIEPKLQELQGETFTNKTACSDDEARPDIKANGLWGNRFERTYFDVRIFNPLATSCPKTIKDAYKYHETIKKLKYEERILEVENSSFNPIVFACTGGAGPSASRIMKKLAEKMSHKRKESYSDTLSYIRTKVSFALLKSATLCIRGCRSLKAPLPNYINSISAIVSEGDMK